MGRSNPSGFSQTGGSYYTGSADEAYKAIRQSTTDVETIARNTGIKPENIQKVKDHISMKNTCLIAMLMLEFPLKCDVLTAN